MLKSAFKNHQRAAFAMGSFRPFGYITLPANTNQAQGLAKYAIDFMGQDNSKINERVYDRTRLFHTDSVLCGISAIAQRTNAPNLFRKEAIKQYSVNPSVTEGKENVRVSKCLGSKIWTHSEKAIAANCSAVREWDSNGTVFGYNPHMKGHDAGEFGHNDFYPVVIAACQNAEQFNGSDALKAMVLLDEIRGRLCEVFSLKSYKIDHVVHGAIASACVYGAMLGATPLQIEHAIGMVVAHYIPWRAIRAGKQLSDSKGASAALSTECAITAVHRAMAGFIGPKDIFRNPEAIFRQFEPTSSHDKSPFDIVLSKSGDDFAVMGMHFKLGLYEHQSASAIGGLIDLISANTDAILDGGNSDNIQKIKITSYEPAFGIIGDPAKRNPTTRQSADHSMVYILSSVLRKAFEKHDNITKEHTLDDLWKYLMLLPADYGKNALYNEVTRKLMTKIEFEHGGPEYDSQYPKGIPTSISIHTNKGEFDSGLVLFPGGHSQNETVSLQNIMQHKFIRLGSLALEKEELVQFVLNLENIRQLSNEQMHDIYDCNIKYSDEPIDGKVEEE